ncbi:hypothetical protein LTS15_006861 [Exophiala xenobiotica]|nr:hypothetical protein LTS15_006861 [Exophiala xenobiotica]
MSGIEVAGIVLAVIPILMQGLDNYKSGLRTLGSGFRKRITVEKLCRVLLLQASTLEELVKHVLLSSGCEAPTHFDAQTRAILSNPEIEPDIAEYLGERYNIFASMMDQCNEILQMLVAKVATFVPAQKSGELNGVIEANRQTQKGQLSLVSRINLVLNLKSLEEDCRNLDESISRMDRFLNRLSANCQLSGVQPSTKSKRLAKTFWRLRKHATHLYTAISKGWELDCHEQHEVKLRLEDRPGERKHRHGGEATKTPLCVFELVFVGTLPSQHRLWHETTVQIPRPSTEDDNDDGEQTSSLTTQQKPPKVKIAMVKPPTGPETQKPREIQGICSAIRQARTDQEDLHFILTSRCGLARPPHRKGRVDPCQYKRTISLASVLDASTNNAKPRAQFSWTARANLALLVASNFLQLLDTPWIRVKLCCDAVSFLQDAKDQLNFLKPFLCLPFGSAAATLGSKPPISDALLELGIMLLEIWDATTLRQKFCLDADPVGRQRQIHALDWYEAVDTQLPGRCSQAIFHCISGIRGAIPGELHSDDMRVWESLCEKVIEPLRVIAEL